MIDPWRQMAEVKSPLLSFVSIAKQSDDTSMLHTVCGSPLYVGKPLFIIYKHSHMLFQKSFTMSLTHHLLAAPEVLKRENYGAPVDLWAVG